MKEYIARRLLALVPVLMIVGVVGFLILHLTPGDPAAMMLGPDATEWEIQQLRTQMGLDLPVGVQLWRWFSRALQGDLGWSLFLKRPVLQAIFERLEPTLFLTTLALFLSVMIGIPSGVLASINHNTVLDQVFMGLSLVGVSMPSFWFGLNLILVFAVWLRWLPVAGYVPFADNPAGTLRSLLLPALTLGFVSSALIARMTRSSMLEVLRLDYVRTARAKGLSERRVIYGHALRNAMIPVITVIGLSLGGLIAGAMVTETVFALPGVGRLVVSSVFRRDYPMIQGALLFVASSYVFVNLLVDLMYVLLDPRIKY